MVKHLGIIPDGSRRWARQNNVTYRDSYWIGMRKLATILDVCFDMGVRIQSVYLLSKENLGRPKADIEPVFEAEERLFLELLPEICHKWKCSVYHAGIDILLPSGYVDALKRLCKRKVNNLPSEGRKLYILAAYSPWDEIQQASRATPNHELIRDHMWVREDVDLVFRTGAGQLLSNFLPMQCGYAELYFSQKLFNDIEIEEIATALEKFPTNGKRLLGK